MSLPQQEINELLRRTLNAHLVEASKRWLGQRSQKASISACEQFIEQCIQLGLDTEVAISQWHVDCYALGLANRGLGASTINTRLCAVKGFMDYLCMRPALQGTVAAANWMTLKYPFKTRKKSSKWHMSDDQRTAARVTMAALCSCAEEAALLDDYIDWTFETGLRVEETLRLLPEDFELLDDRDNAALIVPGTKNEQSKVRIPLSLAAQNIALRRARNVTPQSRRLFDISYRRLHTIWDKLRHALGVQNDPTSTLKALRRNFAAGALRKGLPPRIIQELMRHSNLETTMGYLRLLGMSDNPETRALLNRQLGTDKSWAESRRDMLEAERVPGPMPPTNSLDLFDDKALLDAINKRGYMVARP